MSFTIIIYYRKIFNKEPHVIYNEANVDKVKNCDTTNNML